MSVQAVVLSGGAGERAFPLSTDRPKPMFELLGKPLLQYVIDNLREAGIENVIIVTGPESQTIREYFGDGGAFGAKIQYVTQEKPLGMANALKAAEHLLKDRFFMLNGNDIFEPRLLGEVVDKARKSGSDMALVGREMDKPWRFGVFEFQDGKVTAVVEKPPMGEEPSNIVVVGVYFFSRLIFEYIDRTPLTNYQLEIAYQGLIDEGNVEFVAYDGVFESFKYPWDLLTINEHLMSRFVTEPRISDQAHISDRAIIDGNVIIEEGVRVFENAVVRGPAYVGHNSVIGNNVLIWNRSSIGANSVVGFSSEIKHSLIGRNCWIHMSYAGDSIISDNCSLGAGTITANYRFDESEVPVNVKGEEISSGTDKLGVIMGPDCKTGCNATLMPGTKVGPHSIVGPGVMLRDDLPPDRIIMGPAPYTVTENEIELSAEAKEQKMKVLRERTGSKS
ncbi:MAG TPA: bifunctional sugar-1-phosphate nucleotidylyltransferase/acetyltransferase [Anaerolineae bacterium]|nr:bifunctional sugar-1-phosphate nucleotidylyltransferase/acetyltransferase [Anaerolineae bacterium]